jgi:hypothetical protein
MRAALMAHGYVLTATYESGFALIEDEQDHSPYQPGANVFHAILSNGPTEHGHGRLVTLSLIPDPLDGRDRYDIDWRPLWDETCPRPVYWREMERTQNLETGEDYGPICGVHGFGYQYRDSAGRNVQHVIRLAPDGQILGETS